MNQSIDAFAFHSEGNTCIWQIYRDDVMIDPAGKQATYCSQKRKQTKKNKAHSSTHHSKIKVMLCSSSISRSSIDFSLSHSACSFVTAQVNSSCSFLWRAALSAGRSRKKVDSSVWKWARLSHLTSSNSFAQASFSSAHWPWNAFAASFKRFTRLNSSMCCGEEREAPAKKQTRGENRAKNGSNTVKTYFRID